MSFSANLIMRIPSDKIKIECDDLKTRLGNIISGEELLYFTAVEGGRALMLGARIPDDLPYDDVISIGNMIANAFDTKIDLVYAPSACRRVLCSKVHPHFPSLEEEL